MATQTRIVGTVNQTSQGGDIAWSNPNNITADDNNYATVTLPDTNNQSYYLEGTNCNFDIPLNSIITKITVNYGAKKSVSGEGRVSIVGLIKGGSKEEDLSNLALPSEGFTTSEVEYNINNKLYFNNTFTPQEVNSSDFGAFIIGLSSNGEVTLSVDYLSITVEYYTKLSTISPFASSKSTEDIEIGVDLQTTGGTSIQSVDAGDDFTAVFNFDAHRGANILRIIIYYGDFIGQPDTIDKPLDFENSNITATYASCSMGGGSSIQTGEITLNSLSAPNSSGIYYFKVVVTKTNTTTGYIKRIPLKIN